MESSSTSSSEKNPSGKKQSKTSGFPGFIDADFSRPVIEKMDDEEFHRFYRLYTSQIVKEFYTMVGAITAPGRFKFKDLGKRSIIDKRVAESSKTCRKMNMWMRNMDLLNSIFYVRFIKRKEDENKESSEQTEKPKKRNNK